MLLALRSLRSSGAEYFFDLPRMVLLNLFWFVTALPFIFLAFGVAQVWAQSTSWRELALNVWIVPIGALALAGAGPGTAAIYHVTNRLANGYLLEISRFWYGFRHFFWRGWGLAVLDVGAGALLVLNIVFYWNLDAPGFRLLSLLFGYVLVFWFAIQGYLFGLLVEMDQSIRLVIRNALFLAIDNLGTTLGVTITNFLLLSLSVIPGAALLLLPIATLTISSNMNNKVIVETVERYRAAGRILPGRGSGQSEG